MHELLRHILKYFFALLVAVLLTVIVVLVGITIWLRTDSAQQLVFQYGISLLQEKLHTKVTAGSIGIELFKGQVRIYDMKVNDRDDSLLVRFDELHVGIVPHELLNRKILVTDMELLGADARLWKDSLTSNFQFVVDAFKKDPGARKKEKKGKSDKMELEVDVEHLNIRKLHVKWDVRHKPRKNLNRPNRGAFDANHLDAILNMEAVVTQSEKDTYDVSIFRMNAKDASSGLLIDELNVLAVVNKEKVDVKKLRILLPHSYVNMGRFTIDLKKKCIPEPTTLNAQILLQDIAQPFAPVLSNFTTPLQLRAHVGGPLKCLELSDIKIQSPDKHLHLTAKGTLDGLFGRKEGLNLKFTDIDLRATHNMKEQIVMHFAKKMRLKMLRQMKAVGDIRFQGSVDILHRREIIAGKLYTRFGHLTTRFTIDGNTRYMTGFLETPSMEMGQLMNIPKLGPVKCRIDFDLNISKKSKRPPTALPNGRLPMGTITAKVYDAAYSTVKASAVNVKLHSDGSTASGNLWLSGDLKNMSARVSYVQTDSEQRVWFQLTREAQQWLLQESVGMLSEKLQTDVEADSLALHFFEGDVHLYGIRVKDQSNEPLLGMDTLHVAFNAQELLRNTVHVTHIGLYGLQAQLNKDSLDSNFAFIMQAFKKKKKHQGNGGVQKKKKQLLQLVMDLEDLVVEDMRLKWDVKDKPRKNIVNPSKGTFDANHIDLLLSLQAGVKQTADGGYSIDLQRMNLLDRASGLQFDNIRGNAVWKGNLLRLNSLYLQMPQSQISVDPLTFNIKEKRFLTPFMIYAHVVLQDIARPLAPVLINFTTPIDVQALVSGSINEVHLKDIMFQTPDTRMNLMGQGVLSGITGKKESLHLAFRDVDLNVDNEMLMQLVMHFAKTVRLKMIRQMRKVGDVHYTGNFDVYHKKEVVAGRLITEYGDLWTDFTLDDDTHFMHGFLDAQALQLGNFLNIKHLGAINCHIDFNFNISSKVPRPDTALPNGRLPQGQMKATVKNAKYRILRSKRIEATVSSDGSTATGSVVIPRIVSDLIVNFTYVQTDEEQRLKMRPKIKFHSLRDFFSLFKRRKGR